ncbi:hypothetical protein NESM_000777400 [Novymonas esmeraldas]|uniref:Uncharacterized protein n=1 Tax=Novymonas esmeraldas TaxID=1808958 RepID=A0AAW0EVB7_9TRYP
MGHLLTGDGARSPVAEVTPQWPRIPHTLASAAALLPAAAPPTWRTAPVAVGNHTAAPQRGTSAAAAEACRCSNNSSGDGAPLDNSVLAELHATETRLRVVQAAERGVLARLHALTATLLGIAAAPSVGTATADVVTFRSASPQEEGDVAVALPAVETSASPDIEPVARLLLHRVTVPSAGLSVTTQRAYAALHALLASRIGAPVWDPSPADGLTQHSRIPCPSSPSPLTDDVVGAAASSSSSTPRVSTPPPDEAVAQQRAHLVHGLRYRPSSPPQLRSPVASPLLADPILAGTGAAAATTSHEGHAPARLPSCTPTPRSAPREQRTLGTATATAARASSPGLGLHRVDVIATAESTAGGAERASASSASDGGGGASLWLPREPALASPPAPLLSSSPAPPSATPASTCGDDGEEEDFFPTPPRARLRGHHPDGGEAGVASGGTASTPADDAPLRAVAAPTEGDRHRRRRAVTGDGDPIVASAVPAALRVDASRTAAAATTEAAPQASEPLPHSSRLGHPVRGVGLPSTPVTAPAQRTTTATDILATITAVPPQPPSSSSSSALRRTGGGARKRPRGEREDEQGCLTLPALAAAAPLAGLPSLGVDVSLYTSAAPHHLRHQPVADHHRGPPPVHHVTSGCPALPPCESYVRTRRQRAEDTARAERVIAAVRAACGGPRHASARTPPRGRIFCTASGMPGVMAHAPSRDSSVSQHTPPQFWDINFP